MTAVSYHDTVNVLQGLDLGGQSPFSRLEWFALIEESGRKPLIATLRCETGVVALPLQEGTGHLEPFTNWYAFTWAGLSNAGSEEPRLYEELARGLAARARRVDLTKLPDEDGTASRLDAAFRKAGWVVLRKQCDTNHVLPVDGRPYEEYFASRPGKLRTTLKRKAKKVEVVLRREFEPQDWAQYEEIYAQSWKPEEGDPQLLRKFAEAESAAGRYLFGKALADGKPVAAQFWTVDAGTAYIHKLAHLDSAQKLSPGTTLTAALFEEVIDRDRVEWVDFGTGDDRYKSDWMETTRPRFRLTCLRARDPRNWPLLLKHALRNLVSRSADG